MKDLNKLIPKKIEMGKWPRCECGADSKVGFMTSTRMYWYCGNCFDKKALDMRNGSYPFDDRDSR